FGWARRDPKPGSIRDRDGFIGWGMATAGHTAGGRPGGGARITIGVDGRALVQSGTQDIGTGTYTVMTPVAADGLGMRLDTVRFELGYTNFPVAYTSGASNTVPAVTSGVNR
ncbi:xanthine dehydrogenase family protein molybdopterin-binding subunit, partial [Bacillus paralicheniformis]|nr:xanthine dehydrogenase family protein molybdopterin-binding subunit [Bacillus paralicheniformis]